MFRDLRCAEAIRAGDWILIVRNQPSKLELYNLADDPSEPNNLASTQPEIVKDLREDTQNSRPKPCRPWPSRPRKQAIEFQGLRSEPEI